MEFNILHILAFLSVAMSLVVRRSEAALLPSQTYWNSVLPNSPMPKPLQLLLHPSGWMEDKSTSVGVGKGGVGVYTGKPGGSTYVGVGKGGVNVGTHTKKGKPVFVGVSQGPNPFDYRYAATQTQLHDNPNVAIFFLKKDLIPGKKMNLNFMQTNENQATFLPREVADSLPFSSDKMPEILTTFSVEPSSKEAEIMKNTVQECEKAAVKGEKRFCATSLESMLDFSTSMLGRNVAAISTEVESGDKLKEYGIVGVNKVQRGGAVVACHRQEYAYAVFYCHKSETTEAYKVSMTAEDGSKADAVAVCHLDTAAWNPKHLAFQVLNVKPGSVPVCHFLPKDHVVWVQK